MNVDIAIWWDSNPHLCFRYHFLRRPILKKYFHHPRPVRSSLAIPPRSAPKPCIGKMPIFLWSILLKGWIIQQTKPHLQMMVICLSIFLEVNVHGFKNEEPKVWDPNNYSRWAVEGLASQEVCQGWWAKYEPTLVPDSHSAIPAVSTDTKSENNISKTKTIKIATNMQICRHGKKWPHKK